MRDFRLDKYNNNRPQRDFAGQFGLIATWVVGKVFWELVHQVLERIKNEQYFRRPNKMGGDPMKHNQSFQCQYHQERGHTIKDCRTLWSHLE